MLDHTSSILVFKGASTSFSIVAAPTYIPTDNGNLFSTVSPAFIICRIFNDGHSDQAEVIPAVLLISISLLISDAECVFTCLFTICMSSLEKRQVSWSFLFIGLSVLIVLGCMKYLHNFGK